LNKQVINTIAILIGAGLLLYAMIVDPKNIYLKIGGLIMLMFGLFIATKKWVGDNKTDEDDTE